MLRDQFGTLPPGDIRQALVALSDSHVVSKQILRDLFLYRFEQGDLKGHNFGNLFLTALEQITGSFEDSINIAAKMIKCKGNVIPSTLDNPRLIAEMQSGTTHVGEEAFEDNNLSHSVDTVHFDKEVVANPEAIKAIEQADIIIIGPGSLYTSLITNLLPTGMREAIIHSSAKKILIGNLMTKSCDSENYDVKDMLEVLEKYLEKDIFDYLVVSKEAPSQQLLANYAKGGQKFMQWESCDFSDRKLTLIPADILSDEAIEENPNDIVKDRNLIRYDGSKLAEVLIMLTEFHNVLKYIKK
ncbi:MAG: gluconeogenesis factor YvcK family protein [Patescibacteria group bacterium]|nr:gluconeogenesis factor YvcK family protein [Patescibacteria group bacterium]